MNPTITPACLCHEDQSKQVASTEEATHQLVSAFNLKNRCYILFLDAVYVERPDGSLRFCWGKAPRGAELTWLTQMLARQRIAELLKLGQPILVIEKPELHLTSESSIW